MPQTLKEIRFYYPEYDHVDDAQLADAIYNRFYSGKLDRQAFNSAIG